jgi:signal transduction histidine kinase
MDQLETTLKQIRQRIWLGFLVENIIFAATVYLSYQYGGLPIYMAIGCGAIVSLVCLTVLSVTISNAVLEPLKTIRQAILHISPTANENVGAPEPKTLKIGRDLIVNLVGQLYQIASVAEHELVRAKGENSGISHEFIAGTMPLPLFVLDDSETINYVNQSAADYIGADIDDLVGKNIYMVLDMAFPSDSTFDHWLKKVKGKAATATQSWERVRLNIRDNHPTLLFDLAAYYNQSNSDGNSTYIILFDHTKQYSQDDQAVSFVALSVHELRTPLTLLRGYIEVFEQELKGKITPELEDFMDKMRVSSEQLTAFVNNILNVARIDDDQMELKLQEEDWAKILTHAIDAISLRAKVRGIELKCEIDGGLPTVGVDRLSIQEVINNLVDNAIKYSGESKEIKIHSGLDKEGRIETTIEDHGLGIPANILSNLFTKFYRDHRNRAQIGGTGLGLYLSKAIVAAHGGNLWVKSKEGEGSTFGFTVIPYSELSSDRKPADGDDLIRGAHGWIKNHSYYRR